MGLNKPTSNSLDVSVLETVLERSAKLKELTATTPKGISLELAAVIERKPDARFASVTIDPQPGLDFDTVYSLAVASFYPENRNTYLCPFVPCYIAEEVNKFAPKTPDNVLQYSQFDVYFYADNQRWNQLPISSEPLENQVETVVASLIQEGVFHSVGEVCVDCRSMSNTSQNLLCVVTKTSIPNAYLTIVMMFDDQGIVTALTPVLVFDRNSQH